MRNFPAKPEEAGDATRPNLPSLESSIPADAETVHIDYDWLSKRFRRLGSCPDQILAITIRHSSLVVGLSILAFQPDLTLIFIQPSTRRFTIPIAGNT